MFRLTNVVQHYPWGSRIAIARLRGEPTPSSQPEAELWMGAHERAPSTWVGPDGRAVSLLDSIAEDPLGVLGPRVRSTFGDRLPFLFKVLAAAEPLSLQAHPDAERARRGFDAEERAGLPRDDPRRNYRDPFHKPELICALEPFEALCGFATPDEILERLEPLAVQGLEPLRRRLEHYGVGAAFAWLLESPAAAGVVAPTARACAGRDEPHARWAARLQARYPHDPGVLAALMMRHVRLEPTEALYLGAGNLHAYLEGVGIEIMANSDNVLRGGLTDKHIDGAELLAVLDFDQEPSAVLDPIEVSPGLHVYETPAPEFRLARVDVVDGGPAVELSSDGPQIVLCVEGELAVESLTTPLALRRGDSAFRRAADGPVRLRGAGQAYVASVGATGDREGPSPS